jgi:hypothetical protein
VCTKDLARQRGLVTTRSDLQRYPLLYPKTEPWEAWPDGRARDEWAARGATFDDSVAVTATAASECGPPTGWLRFFGQGDNDFWPGADVTGGTKSMRDTGSSGGDPGREDGGRDRRAPTSKHNAAFNGTRTGSAGTRTRYDRVQAKGCQRHSKAQASANDGQDPSHECLIRMRAHAR